jgi:hypothetical protein
MPESAFSFSKDEASVKYSITSFKKQSSFIAEEHACIYTVAVFKAPPSSCYLVSKNATKDERKGARGIKLLIL